MPRLLAHHQPPPISSSRAAASGGGVVTASASSFPDARLLQSAPRLVNARSAPRLAQTRPSAAVRYDLAARAAAARNAPPPRAAARVAHAHAHLRTCRLPAPHGRPGSPNRCSMPREVEACCDVTARSECFDDFCHDQSQDRGCRAVAGPVRGMSIGAIFFKGCDDGVARVIVLPRGFSSTRICSI